MRVPDTLPEGNNIECPTINYLYYVIDNTLQARGDFTRVNEDDMMVLTKAIFPNCNIKPHLGVLLVMYLKHQALEARGPICGGESLPFWHEDLTSMYVIYKHWKDLAVLVFLL
jgi:hypothetical protein